MPRYKDSEKDHLTLTRDQWKGKLFRYIQKRREKRRKLIAKLFVRSSVVLGVAIVAFFISLYALPGSAYVSNIYSTTCLGGWENPQHAQGEPNVTTGSERYTSANSAVLKNRVAELFCGGFSREGLGHIEPTEITLRFSLSVREQSEDVLHIQDNQYETRAEEILDAPKDVEVKFELIEPTDESNSTLEGETTSSEPESGDAGSLFNPEPSSEAESAPVSGFFRNVITLLTPEVGAQEEAVGEVEGVDLQEEVFEAFEDVVSTNNDLLEVHYTTDGGTWKKLGGIYRDTWEFATFKLPLEVWENLENLQVRVKSVASFDEKPTMYLDALWLEVRHQKKLPFFPDENLLDALGLEKVTGNFLEINSHHGDTFEADETPEFVFILPEIIPTEKTERELAPDIPTEREETSGDVELEAQKEDSDTPSESGEVEGEGGGDAENSTEETELPEENFDISFSSHLVQFFKLLTPEVFAGANDDHTVIVKVFNPLGERVDAPPNIREHDGLLHITLSKAKPFIAGRYRIEVSVAQDEKMYVSEKTFLWGAREDFVINSTAVHNCELDPFRIEVSENEKVRGKIILYKDSNARFQIEVGGLPEGVDIKFLKNGGYVYSPQGNETSLALEVKRKKGSQKGDFTIPFIYTEKNSADSHVVCQLNVVNR